MTVDEFCALASRLYHDNAPTEPVMLYRNVLPVDARVQFRAGVDIRTCVFTAFRVDYAGYAPNGAAYLMGAELHISEWGVTTRGGPAARTPILQADCAHWMLTETAALGVIRTKLRLKAELLQRQADESAAMVEALGQYMGRSDSAPPRPAVETPRRLTLQRTEEKHGQAADQ